MKKKALELLADTDTIIVAGLTAAADCKTKIGTIAELNMQISDALVSCKTAPDVDAPAPAAFVPDADFPADAALLTASEPVLAVLRSRPCKKLKRTTLAIMMTKKLMDVAATCQDDMVKNVDDTA